MLTLQLHTGITSSHQVLIIVFTAGHSIVTAVLSTKFSITAAALVPIAALYYIYVCMCVYIDTVLLEGPWPRYIDSPN